MAELNNNFWKWFGNSKVVNPDGTPMIVYHGTNKEFSAFNKLFAHNGFYFVTDKRKAEVAGYYAYSNDRNGKIMPCYLSVQNPYICTPQTKDDVDFSKYDGIIVLSDFDFQSNYYDYEQKELKISDMKKGDIVEIIVWNPNQIKSVNNKGNWSTNSDNIYESRKNKLVQTAEELDKLCEKREIIGNIDYLYNPTKLELQGLLNNSKDEVRGILMLDTDEVYIWNAYNHTHSQVSDILGLDGQRVEFIISGNSVLGNGPFGNFPGGQDSYYINLLKKSRVGDYDLKFNENFYTKSRGNKMNEEATTFFKDKKNKNGSRVKNPNRVYAAKKAHKTHGFSYKRAAEKMTCSEIADFLDREVSEANITADNKVNMYSEISFSDLTGAFQVQVKENLTDFDVILVAKDNGNGSYKLEGESSDKMQTSLIYNTLVNDLKTLADNIDRDFEAILKKNGLVKRVD